TGLAERLAGEERRYADTKRSQDHQQAAAAAPHRRGRGWIRCVFRHLCLRGKGQLQALTDTLANDCFSGFSAVSRFVKPARTLRCVNGWWRGPLYPAGELWLYNPPPNCPIAKASDHQLCPEATGPNPGALARASI